MNQQHNGWCPGMSLAEVERETILLALHHYNKNKTAAAQCLGISVRTLDGRLEQYEKEVTERKQREQEKAARDAAFLKRCQHGNLDAPKAAELPANADVALNGGAEVQPPPSIPPRQSMPVSEREDVRNVLSRSSPSSGSRRARG